MIMSYLKCVFVYIVDVTVHTAGRNEEHEDKLKMTVFNVDARQDKAGQAHRNK